MKKKFEMDSKGITKCEFAEVLLQRKLVDEQSHDFKNNNELDSWKYESGPLTMTVF